MDVKKFVFYRFLKRHYISFTLRKFECSKQATLVLPIFEDHSIV